MRLSTAAAAGLLLALSTFGSIAPVGAETAPPQRCFGALPTILDLSGASVYGTAGPDVIIAEGPVHAGAGDDLVCWSLDIHGGPGDDRLNLSFQGRARGEDGDDLLISTADGRQQDDWAYLIGGRGDDTFYGPGAGDRVGGNEWVLGGPGHDRAFMARNDDVLRLGPGNDVGYGGRGDDRLSGGPGYDRLHGEHGRDRCRAGERLRSCEVR